MLYQICKYKIMGCVATPCSSPVLSEIYDLYSCFVIFLFLLSSVFID
jgi:hypothetical protein